VCRVVRLHEAAVRGVLGVCDPLQAPTHFFDA
jgi:hypothetical protein